MRRLRLLTHIMIGLDRGTPDIHWRQLGELFRITPHLLAALGIGLAAVEPWLHGQIGAVYMALGLIASQLTMRIAGQAAFRRRKDASLTKWTRIFAVVSAASGLFWGLALASLYLGGNSDSQLIVLAVGCGIIQSAAARAFMSPAPMLINIALVMSTVSTAAALEGQWMMAPICAVYFLFQLTYLARLSNLYLNEIQAGCEREIALEQLADANKRLKQANEQLARHALTDGLTGIANRRSFDAVLNAAFDDAGKAEPLSLILLDIDHFKAFNDTHGHQAGDDCLRLVARVITDALADSRYRAARYGGEEFALVLPGADSFEAARFAETLRSVIESVDTSDLAGAPQSISASLGAATRTRADQTPADLVARADRALYRAKQKGRNRVAVDGEGDSASA
ncbi:diguanylate cyclase (GGDEF)-like protein [Rhizobium sp. SG_E_25_P2]|uniref:GGDEF domain-containing protein n=1 Tax=Rhizobium sp. SG_E_25_P2 TaxID=2879942 RepID=UPI002475FACA|nr:GGDEF domain-containing protein [Rhizobium sp. SG_E_25_P2]MDH6267809.1 diguanylate cyclase (GGDEF)-like protein [Rhizobium sp. SG_E_25_P2]